MRVPVISHTRLGSFTPPIEFSGDLELEKAVHRCEGVNAVESVPHDPDAL